MSNLSLSNGRRIELNDGRIGTIRFIGPTSFQTGEWIGVELEDASGKNDGSVQGERYFSCPPKHGIFCRASGISQVLEEVKAKPKSAINGTSARPRPSSVHVGVNGVKKIGSVDLSARRTSTIASANPAPVSRLMSGIRSPTKSPTKQLGTNGTTSSAISRTSTPPVAARTSTGVAAKPRPGVAPKASVAAKRTSMLPPATTQTAPRSSRLSTVPAAATVRAAPARVTSGTASTPVRSATQQPPRQPHHVRQSTDTATAQDEDTEQTDTTSRSESAASETTQSEDESGANDNDRTIQASFAPPPVPPIPPDNTDRNGHRRRPSSPTAASVHSQKTIRSTAASTRQIEELEAKLRLLERKRLEDREVKQHLEQAQQERDQLKNIIEKLQKKYRPQQQELERLRKEALTFEKTFASIEELQADHDQAMESALLDREVAEETAEGYKADLEFLRAKNEEMELELEILREENGELSKEMSPEERSSAGWLQLEKSNDRLKMALLSLRDLAHDKEAELKEQIAEMEQEIHENTTIKKQYDDIKEKLARSNADNEEVRQQLEVALGAEDMIESLTEENMNMRDRVAELRGVIEDLESLRELNDELEINHIEAEKQLQEELDFKDSLLYDRERTAKDLQAALDEADYNISRFRTLVSQLQNDLQDLEASKQISETEAADLSSKSRAMVDLNSKLQVSAAKTQVKTIDLELQRLEAQQAVEHLDVVRLFLPDAFNTERDSVLALFRFKRIAFKATLIQGLLKERIASFGTRGQDEDVFIACDAVDKLTWIAGMAGRLVNAISSCDIKDFVQYGSSLYELEGVERTLNDYIEGFRRNEIREAEFNVRLGRSIEVMTHLASLHIHDGLTEQADAILMKSLCLQNRLESTISALSLTRAAIETNLHRPQDDELEYEDENASDTALILQRLKTTIDQLRNAKVISSKVHRALSDLEARSLTLEPQHAHYFDKVGNAAQEIIVYSCLSGADIQALFNEEGRTESFAPSEVTAILARQASSIFSVPSTEPGPYATLVTRVRSLSDMLADLSLLPSDLDNTAEFERASAPWVARADEVQRTKIASVDTEAELARAIESIRERDSLIRTKESELEEQSVRIEMLEARMKEASKRSAKFGDLERKLADARENEKRAKQDLDSTRADSQRELDRVRDEMSRLAKERAADGATVPTDVDVHAVGATTRLTLQRQETKIAGLEGAVRYLKTENVRLRLPAPNAPVANRGHLAWLHEPLCPPVSARRKQQEELHRQGGKVLEELLSLAARPQIVDLTTLPANKLAWRPIKEHSRWKVERSREEWVGWMRWKGDVLEDVREFTGK